MLFLRRVSFSPNLALDLMIFVFILVNPLVELLGSSRCSLIGPREFHYIRVEGEREGGEDLP